jgi:tRNA G26 N,N-dimethylase Trm1
MRSAQAGHDAGSDAQRTTTAAMSYLHCPRCRLAIKCRAHYLTLTNCPRCLARAQIVSPLFTSPLTARELHAKSDPPDAIWQSIALRAVRDDGPEHVL